MHQTQPRLLHQVPLVQILHLPAGLNPTKSGRSLHVHFWAFVRYYYWFSLPGAEEKETCLRSVVNLLGVPEYSENTKIDVVSYLYG